MLEIKPLFPKPIGFKYFEETLTAKQKNFILDLKRTKNTGNYSSQDRFLSKHKILKNLNKFLYSSINEYFNEVYRPKNTVSLRITQMWANYSSKEQWHHQHWHPNSFISAVFYVQCDSEKDKIYFNKSQYEQLDVYTEDYNIFNSQEWYFPVKENLLIMFPSNLSHRVLPVESDKTRISISMNTFPVGILGRVDTCTECVLK